MGTFRNITEHTLKFRKNGFDSKETSVKPGGKFTLDDDAHPRIIGPLVSPAHVECLDDEEAPEESEPDKEEEESPSLSETLALLKKDE